MNITIDLKYEPTKDCILLYNGERWVCVKKDIFLLDVKRENEYLQAQINGLQEKYNLLVEKFDDLKNNINDKLKEYHKVLQMISKGD